MAGRKYSTTATDDTVYPGDDKPAPKPTTPTTTGAKKNNKGNKAVTTSAVKKGPRLDTAGKPVIPLAERQRLHAMAVKRSAMMKKISAGKKKGTDMSALRKKRAALNRKIYTQRQAAFKKGGNTLGT